MRMSEEQKQAKKTAESLLDGSYVFMDTETTGTSKRDEVINLAFADRDGKMLYSRYFRNEQPMNPDASRVSGITDEMLMSKPTFIKEWDKINDSLKGRKYAIFNADFDTRLMRQTFNRYEFKYYRNDVPVPYSVGEKEYYSQANIFNNITRERRLPEGGMDRMLEDSVCTMKLYCQYINTSVWMKMEEACHAEGINVVQDHLADSDTSLMVELMKRVADPETRPSLYKNYCAILDKEDDPAYKPNKEFRILNDMVEKTMKKFNDCLSESSPSASEDSVRLFKECYDFDFPMNFKPDENVMDRLIEKDRSLKDYMKDHNMVKMDIRSIGSLFSAKINKSIEDKKYYRSSEYKENKSKRCVDLFNQGNSVSRIARILGYNSEFGVKMALRNEFSKNPGCVNLTGWVIPKYIDPILEASRRLDTTRLKPIREDLKLKLPNDIAYDTISATLLYNEAGMLDELKKESKGNYYDYRKKEMHIANPQIHPEKDNSAQESQLNSKSIRSGFSETMDTHSFDFDF